jgi:hypothetical protein
MIWQLALVPRPTGPYTRHLSLLWNPSIRLFRHEFEVTSLKE